MSERMEIRLLPLPLCTWRDCKSAASMPQLDNAGEQWANLCTAHDAEQTKAQESGDAKVILRCWALAHGSREAFAARMMR